MCGGALKGNLPKSVQATVATRSTRVENGSPSRKKNVTNGTPLASHGHIKPERSYSLQAAFYRPSRPI